jgi:hypothetical protein
MRSRNLVLVSILVAVGAVAVTAFLMRGNDRTRNDAMLFLDRFGALDVDSPVLERLPHIEALASMPFASEEITEVRDLCVEAHRTLLVAEERGAEARASFDRATDQGRLAESDISPETRASIEAALGESNRALERVRPLMTRCDDRVRGLRARFRAPRRSER